MVEAKYKIKKICDSMGGIKLICGYDKCPRKEQNCPKKTGLNDKDTV